MYLSLPVDSLRRTTLPNSDPSFRAWLAIGLVPHGIKTTAAEAEQASWMITMGWLNRFQSLKIKDFWLDILWNEKMAPAVIRTALMTRERYRKHLGYLNADRNADSNGNTYDDKTIMEMTRRLPKRFWISEITLPDLYSTNKTKLVDVLYRCDKKPTIKDGERSKKALLVRFPHLSIRMQNGIINDIIPTNITGHFPLFRVSKEIGLFEG